MTDACPGGRIQSVRAGGAAERMRLRPGDELVEVNGRPVFDILDTQFFAAEGVSSLAWRRGGKAMRREVREPLDLPLGAEFAHPTFDTPIRTCNNRCPFCFVTQMPRGMRRTLHIKDDDYRYSFLYGHFVTLTNLKERDWRKIGEQRLSPLYVSVHATEPDVRARVLGKPAPEEILGTLRRLAEMGISIHAQVVVCPELNDGAHLARTVRDLADLHPAVRSCSIVPVGLTRYHRRGLRTHTRDECAQMIRTVDDWQAACLARLDTRFAFATDEWYLAAGREPPGAEAYEDLDLRENGLGMVRDFLDGWDVWQACAQPPAVVRIPSAILVTGTLFHRLLAGVSNEYSRRIGVRLETIPARNHTFGDTVTVAGLLAAADILRAMDETPPAGRPVILPKRMFAHPGALSLDDQSPLDLARALGVDVYLAENMDEVHRAVTGKSPFRARPRDAGLGPRFLRAGGWEAVDG